MRRKTCLLVMLLLVGGCGTQGNDSLDGQGASPPERVAGAGVVHFSGITRPADDVLYLIDRSGSTFDTFDKVYHSVLQSVKSLGSEQRFHVIFYSIGKPKENPPKKLVLATEKSKKEFVKFVQTVTPEGQTDPIPAIKRAFDVLNSDQKRKTVIFLVTDGEFPDNKKVIDTIKQLNKSGRISVNTILFFHRCPEAVIVLKKIAEENGGVFKFVSSDD